MWKNILGWSEFLYFGASTFYNQEKGVEVYNKVMPKDLLIIVCVNINYEVHLVVLNKFVNSFLHAVGCNFFNSIYIKAMSIPW